jgi:predicted membrane GTPase involved in stress response
MKSVSVHYVDTGVATTWQAQGAGEMTVSSLLAKQTVRKRCFETTCTEAHNYMKLGEQK